MCGNGGANFSIPTPQQSCRASIIELRQTKAAIFLGHLDSKRANLRESFEIFRWNFARAVDLVRIDMFAQISFKLAQKFFASGAIFCALRGIRVNSIEIVAADIQLDGETAAVVERITRGFSQLERFALDFRHL